MLRMPDAAMVSACADVHDGGPVGSFVQFDAEEAQRQRGDSDVGVQRVYRDELQHDRRSVATEAE